MKWILKLPFPGLRKNIKYVKKQWGLEVWLCNNEKYCAKFLILKPGYQCSLHAHRYKDETFIVLSGKVNLETLQFKENGEKTVNTLKAGNSYRILPDLFHRFSSKLGALILEVSTTHSDEDVIRLEESRKL